MSNEAPNENDTQPTITTLLERINAVGEAITARINTLEEKVRSDISEVSSSIRRLERKIEVLNESLLEVQADNREFRDRLEQLESRAS